MTMNEFYELSYDDLVDVLILLKIKYHLHGISKQKIFQLARSIREGFRPEDLKTYLFGVSRQELKNELELSDSLYEKFNTKLDHTNELLDMEAQRLINLKGKE